MEHIRLEKINILSYKICYGQKPDREDEVEQQLMITTDGNYYGDSDPINTWVRFGPGTVKSKPIFGIYEMNDFLVSNRYNCLKQFF